MGGLLSALYFSFSYPTKCWVNALVPGSEFQLQMVLRWLSSREFLEVFYPLGMLIYLVVVEALVELGMSLIKGYRFLRELSLRSWVKEVRRGLIGFCFPGWGGG